MQSCTSNEQVTFFLEIFDSFFQNFWAFSESESQTNFCFQNYRRQLYSYIQSLQSNPDHRFRPGPYPGPPGPPPDSHADPYVLKIRVLVLVAI